MPERFDKAIYLDGDLLVRADVSALWEADLGGKPLLAVREYSAPVLSSRAALPNYSELGLDPRAAYLNGGVLVMDLRRWRAEEIESAGLAAHGRACGREPLRRPGRDQCRTGRSVEGARPRWNVPAYVSSNRVFNIFEASPHKDWLRHERWALIREAYIFHYIGPAKPWGRGCGLPGQLAWLRTLRRSGWYGPGELGAYVRSGLLQVDWLLRNVVRRVRDGSPGGAGPSSPLGKRRQEGRMRSS